MIKAIVQNGMIVPSEPLPEEWKEGTHVAVEMANAERLADTSIHRADVWMDEVEAIAQQGDPADDLRLDAAIQAILRREKENAGKRATLQP